MALEIKRSEQQRAVGVGVANRRLYLNAAKDTVVEDGDPRAAFLFATPELEIGRADMERFGLSIEDGVVVLPGAAPAKVTEEPAEAMEPPAAPGTDVPPAGPASAEEPPAPDTHPPASSEADSPAAAPASAEPAPAADAKKAPTQSRGGRRSGGA